jgi:hypothetical protein
VGGWGVGTVDPPPHNRRLYNRLYQHVLQWPPLGLAGSTRTPIRFIAPMRSTQHGKRTNRRLATDLECCFFCRAWRGWEGGNHAKEFRINEIKHRIHRCWLMFPGVLCLSDGYYQICLVIILDCTRAGPWPRLGDGCVIRLALVIRSACTLLSLWRAET